MVTGEHKLWVGIWDTRTWELCRETFGALVQPLYHCTTRAPLRGECLAMDMSLNRIKF